jgi:hypothetical protein
MTRTEQRIRIARSRRLEREAVKAARYYIKHKDYESALLRLSWAIRQKYYAEGLAVTLPVSSTK